MKRLLTICPSRNRPDRLQEMLDSFYKTKSDFTDILIYVSNDDPRLEEYKKLNAPIVYGDRKYIVEVFNHIFNLNPDYEYYHEINDDHVYHTKEWDKLLTAPLNGFGISCGGTSGLPSGIVISGNIPRALGYIAYPGLRHTYVDNYFEDLGEGIERYFWIPEVNIEHKHFLFGKAQNDENYRWVTSAESMDYGKKAYMEWVINHKRSDIEKVLNACRSNN